MSEMMEKRGVVTPESKSDLDTTKKAEFYDEDSFLVVSKEDKDKLNKPKEIK